VGRRHSGALRRDHRRTQRGVLADPHLVNVDPYGAGWIAKLRPEDPDSALAGLSTGETATAALKQWIDRYDVECMRCSD
jgi:glycine cleavage system H protein